MLIASNNLNEICRQKKDKPRAFIISWNADGSFLKVLFNQSSMYNWKGEFLHPLFLNLPDVTHIIETE